MELLNWITGIIVFIIFLLFIYYYGLESIVLFSTLDTGPEEREKILKHFEKKKIDINQDMPFSN